MAFNTAISGIRAANRSLDVIGNNVANSATVGFKSSRVEFADVINAASVSSSSNAGGGVNVSGITQQFKQGNSISTGGELDMSIAGSGFFQVSDNGSIMYTRAGAFTRAPDGSIQDAAGRTLRGFVIDSNGNLSGEVGDLTVSKDSINPQATSEVTLNLNFNPNADTIDQGVPANAFDPTNSDTFNQVFQSNVIDSQGNTHTMSTYLIKTAANTWDAVVRIDDTDVGGAVGAQVPYRYTMTFDGDGNFASVTPPGGAATLSIPAWEPKDADGVNNGATSPNPIALTVSGSTQHKGEFNKIAEAQNGFERGRFSQLEVNDKGLILARYTNGQAKTLGQVAIADFDNIRGLRPIGDTAWVESSDSGTVKLGQPGSGSLGSIRAGELEGSDVNLTEELVKLILAQRDFQANAQSIKTEDAVTQTISNLR